MGLVYVVVLVISNVLNYAYCQAPVPGTYQHQIPNKLQRTVTIGPCRFVLNPQCPDPDVTFFMYSHAHPESPEPIYAATHVRGTNLEKTSFDPAKPSKIIIHGYNSNMFLSALTELRREYLKTKDYNVFAVDWSPLNQAPCYPAAVWNARHVGTCTAQLVDRIRDMGAVNIHVIGFSLGAHITNFLSLALNPYRLPRITGLDPALPGYITAGNDEKLDKSDAEFVDVYHTNAFMQGKAEESGHVDFYFNGGSIQPGCLWGGTENFFSCNHHRAPLYYAESINSPRGFWGMPCPSYFDYLLGRCIPSEIQVLLGENINKAIYGTFMVITASTPPFAVGPYDISIEVTSLKLTKPTANKINVSSDSAMMDMPMFTKYQQEIVQPSALDESELFSQVMDENLSNSVTQGPIFMSELGLVEDNEVK